MFVYSFIVASLIVILGLSQLIVNFNSSEVIEKELVDSNQNTICLEKTDPKDEEILVFDESKIIDIITGLNKIADITTTP